MSVETAIEAATTYAAEWGVPLDSPALSGTWRTWWLLFQPTEYSFEYTSHSGTGEFHVARRRRKWRVTRFEFYPTADSHNMLPLWAAYPTYCSVTIGWRMGWGEDYKYKWHAWYDALSDDRKAQYKERYPANGDWDYFYTDVADYEPDPESYAEIIMGRVPRHRADA